MKKLVTFIVLVFITLVATGCTRRSCMNCFGSAFKESIACSFEKMGDFNDCVHCLFAENCTDRCYVAPCYGMADCTRVCTLESCGCESCIKKDLDKISEKCKVEFHVEFESIKNLKFYYKVKILITVTAFEDIKDVVVVFDVSDSNGNKFNNINAYIASKIEGGKYYYENKEITLTFSYNEQGNHYNNEGYSLKYNLVAVYGRV